MASARFRSTRPRRKRSSGCAVKRLLRTSDISGHCAAPEPIFRNKGKAELAPGGRIEPADIRAHHVDPVALLARQEWFRPISGAASSLWPLPEIPAIPRISPARSLKRYAGERHGERIVRLVIEPDESPAAFRPPDDGRPVSAPACRDRSSCGRDRAHHDRADRHRR